MTQNRSQWNLGQVQWAKKPSHDSMPSSSKNSSLREPPKEDGWNNWGETGPAEPAGPCWNVPLKFEGDNREEYRVVFDWDDSAAVEAYIRRGEATKEEYDAEVEKLSAHIDWETRRICNLPECAEVMTRDENRRKAKGSFTRHEQSRVRSPVIIGLPGGRDLDGNDCAVAPLHLPFGAVPPATGWGDEGDVVLPAPTGWVGGYVPSSPPRPCDGGPKALARSGWDDCNVAPPAPTGWDEGNRAPPAPTGWGDEGVLAPPASWWEQKEDVAHPSSAWGGWTHQDSGHLLEKSVASHWVEVAARRGPSRWAEVAARPAASERDNQACGWEDCTTETHVAHVASEWDTGEPFATGRGDTSHDQIGMNAGWMQHPTYPTNPHSYKHIKPSGWGDIPEESAPTPDVEMNQYPNGWGQNVAVHDLPRNSSSGWDSRYGDGEAQQEKQRNGFSRPFKYGSGSWRPKESEPHSNFEPHCRRNFQRPGRSPFAINLRVNQDSKPSRGSRWERAKTSVWQAACALSHEERASLVKNAKNSIKT